MKKTIKELAQFISMIMVLAGLVVCMCESENPDQQLATLGIGLGMIIFGALLGVLAHRGEENEFPG